MSTVQLIGNKTASLLKLIGRVWRQFSKHAWRHSHALWLSAV